MLGFISRLGSSKGMVLVPNFAGLNSATANSQLASAGLVLNPLSGEVATNNSAQGGIGLTQFPAAGTLVDYETAIIVNFGKFVADTVTVSPCQGYTTPVNDSDYCSGTLYVYGPTRTKNRKTVTTTNNVAGTSTITYDYSCADTVVPRGSEYINGQCGHVVAPVSCTPTATTTFSTCTARFLVYATGTQTRTTSGIDSACNPYSNSVSYTCWQATCADWTGWVDHLTDPTKQRRIQLCQRTNGTTYFNEQERCKTTYTYAYGTCRNGRISKTTRVFVCGVYQSQSTAQVPCAAI
jgi:hypothetical protein